MLGEWNQRGWSQAQRGGGHDQRLILCHSHSHRETRTQWNSKRCVGVCVCARVYTDVVVMVYVYHSVPGKRSYVPGVTVAASIYSNIWNFDPV